MVRSMDGISLSLKLPSHGIEVSFEPGALGFGAISFKWQQETVIVQSVDLAELSRTTRSSMYALLFYDVTGHSYIDSTALTASYSKAGEDILFQLHEGATSVHAQRMNPLQGCNDIGRMSVWIKNHPWGDPAKGDSLNKPDLYFAEQLLVV
jgi:hypothetical protein